MAVPDFQTSMLPVLQAYADGKERMSSEVRDGVAKQLGLTAEDVAERLPTAPQSSLANRIAWAHSYLKQSRLLESPRKGTRGDGSEVEPVLSDSGAANTHSAALTRDEQVREGAARIRENLAAQLLDRVKQASPAFFENLVVDLLVAMGCGGTHEDAAKVVRRSGDGGIDGVIKQGRLGLESIYVQAKRWEASAGRPVIQQFAGALAGHHARKGVVLTTLTFSPDAVAYAKGLQTTIALIGGKQPADLMIEFGVGVNEGETIKLERVDEDYFGEELE